MTVISARAAAELVPDNATLAVSGIAVSGWAEEVGIAIEQAFLETGHPRGLTLMHAAGIGNYEQMGIHHLGHEGLVTWVCSLDQDGHARPNGQVSEITQHLDLTSWPHGTRVIVRRERAHPGAQLSFTDHDGHRFQAILTDQTGPVAGLERDHRGRARVEDHIRNDKDTGLRNLPFRDFAHNQVWLAIVRLAHDLIAWTQRLLLAGELAKAEPKRLRYRLLHIAARLAFHARTATLHLPAAWPWAEQLTAAFTRLAALPAPA
jgi:hypothetical protein